MKIEPLSKADLLKVEAINDYHLYNDPRPLTDETLDELGFEKRSYTWAYYLQDEYGTWDLETIQDDSNGLYSVIINHSRHLNIDPVYKTVGSVKMLIEALKGDE